MIKRRDYEKIASISLYTKEINNELKVCQNNLINDIIKIPDYYTGIDSEIIINKLLDGAKKLDKITENIEYYSNYLKKISNNDKYNIDEHYNKLLNINNEPITNSTSEVI